jgi:enoyl-CoA hydratase
VDPGPAPLLSIEAEVNEFFRGEYFSDIIINLQHTGGRFALETLKKLEKPSPLAMAATIEMIHRVRGLNDIVPALEMEYRFTHRSAEEGDFIEGIRALVIDKDKSPKWQHGLTDPLLSAASAMLRPLGPLSLDLTET